VNNIDYSKYYWQNEKVRLRAMKESDWEEHYKSIFDSEARRFLEYELELPPTEENSKNNILKYCNFSPEEKRLMFIIENMQGEAVGGTNLNSIDERNGTFSIGMQIYPGHRSKGYGTTALLLLLDYAFNERRLNKFNVSIFEGNIASEMMLKKAGCRREGIRRQNIYTKGEYYDEVLYGLTRSEFLKAKKYTSAQQ
jgi:RimJ/RimL family protein N-acetyltransferase